MNYIEKGVKLKLNFRSGGAFAFRIASKYLSNISPTNADNIKDD